MLFRRRLLSTLSNPQVKGFIKQVITENDVVVFMKGTASSPMCGFSRNVCKLLEIQGVDKFTSVNVLEDEELRSGIKEFTEWPTIPQVFIKGKFIGGNDILMEMNKSGELKELLEKEKLIK